jgi:formamidopyrimidine-DNA glycosylase
MPELPEVETVRRGLERLVLGKTIQSVKTDYPRMIRTGDSSFKRALKGQTIEAIERRGKYLIISLGEQAIVSHLRMEGKYLYHESDVPNNPHAHVWFSFTDGTTMVYQDVRKFGTMDLIATDQLGDYFISHKIGPEPTTNDFKLGPFKTALNTSTKKIKPYLLDQSLVAGLGNIYVDEVLWAAKIHPLRVANTLTDTEIKALRKAIIDTLAFGVEKGGSTIRTYRNALGEDGSMQDYLKVYGKTGQPCPRCQTPIEKIKVGGRGSHFCPNCQKL